MKRWFGMRRWTTWTPFNAKRTLGAKTAARMVRFNVPRLGRGPAASRRFLTVGLAALLMCTLSVGAVALHAVRTAHADSVGYPNVFTFTNSDQWCETLRRSGDPAAANGYLPPTTEQVQITANGAAGKPGASNPLSGESGGNGAVITGRFAYPSGSVPLYISPGSSNGYTLVDPLNIGLGAPANDSSDQASGYTSGGNAAVVGLGAVNCNYQPWNLLAVAGGGGGGGDGDISGDGGTGGNAGDDSGVNLVGQDGTHGGEIASGQGGYGGGGGTQSQGGLGGHGGACPGSTRGGAGGFLQPFTYGIGGGGDDRGTNNGGSGGGGYYGGGGGGGGTCSAGGGGGGGGSSYIDQQAVVGAASAIASNTSTNSSVTIRALTPLTITPNDKTYVYGSGGSLPAFDASYSGFISHQKDGSNVDTPASLGGTLTFHTDATASSPAAGYYGIYMCACLTSDDYVLHYGFGTLHVVAAGTSIAMPPVISATAGNTVTVSASVTPVSPSTATVNEGQVSFTLLRADGTPFATAGPVSVSNGTASASFTTSGLAAGTYTVQAAFADGTNVNGQTNYNNSSAQSTLFLLNSGVSLTTSDVATANNGAAAATVDNGQLTALASGSGKIAIGQYNTDPESAAPPTPVNAYFDVYTPPGSSFSTMTVTDCNLAGGQVVYWWNGSAWAPVSNQGYDSTTKCATITINASTSPSVTQLSGTPFGVGMDSDLALTNVPANITTNATSSSGAAVTYTAPSATDGDDAKAPSVSCDHASGSTFPIGTTTVTCTATDSEDANSPASASFTVTVNDTDLALTNVPGNQTLNATSPAGAVVSYTAPAVVDEDSPLPTVNCDHASGSTFPIGTTTVTCTASASGDANSPVSANFSVTVKGAADQTTDLKASVDSLGLGKQQASYDTQLQAVLTDLSTNNGLACGDLTAFINHVSAQSGKQLTTAQANQVLAAAKQIQAVIGC